MPRSPISTNERAWLDTIRMAEGTWHGGGEKGYGTMFGGGQFDWRRGHPDRVVRSGGYASAAAGAYQFMPDTWRGVARKLGMDPADFSPAAQDRAALQLIRQRGVDPTRPMTTDSLARLAPEWASLPTAAGKSYYGQPVKKQDELLSFFSRRAGAPNPGNSAPSPAPRPAPGAALPAGVGGGGGGLGGLLVPPAFGGETPRRTAGSAIDSGSNPVLGALQRGLEMLSTPNPIIRRSGNTSGGSATGRRPQQRMAGSPGPSYLQRLQSLINFPGF